MPRDKRPNGRGGGGAGYNNRGGGRGRGRGGGRGGGRGRGGSRGGAPREDRWNNPRSEITRANEGFQEYYDRQKIVPDEKERTKFWEAMKEDLPNSFRFAGSRGHALTVQRRLIDHYIPELTGVEYEGQPVAPPQAVGWFPDKLAWEMKTPKKVIRKFPPFASFQKFLVSENNVGNITRQEIVSMIPPLLLDIKPGMTVLDLCAAPGSKSAQIIEMVHGGEEARVRKVLEDVAKEEGRELGPEGFEVNAEKEQAEAEDDYSDDGRSTGLLVANDVDYRRAQMLVHQCKRLNSPNLVVVNHDATLFPSIKIPSKTGNSYLKFDRILADVPCSGDGTTRKNTEIWKDWSITKGLGLHQTQVRILVRSLQMLKVGGRVVYSTCSLNPIENEAVIASAIERCGGVEKVKLVSKDEALPGLKRAHGLKTWEVLDRTGEWWNSYKQMRRTREERGDEVASKVVEGMFPPDVSQNIPLERCMRVYPHMQDTGGFFITVLEKQTEIKARPEGISKEDSEPVKGSAMAMVKELDEKMATGDLDTSTKAADEALAQENEANALQTTTIAPNPRKRSNDEFADTDKGDSSSKRVKVLEDSADPAISTAPERQVHWPPPPAAQMDLAADHPDIPNTLNMTSGGDDTTTTITDGPNAENHAPQDIPADTAIVTSADQASAKPTTTQQQEARPPKQHTSNPQEESFIYLQPDHPELQEAFTFYALSPRFPRDRFMVRNPAGEPVKAIYYTSALSKSILETNAGTGIKFVHCGVKMFVKQDVGTLVNAGVGEGVSKWRIQSEGLGILEGWVGEKRVVRCWRRSTLRKLLGEMFPRISKTGDPEDDGLAELKEQVQKLGPGCAVLRVGPRTEKDADTSTTTADDDAETFTESLTLPLWRGASSLNLMLPKDERKAMLLRLFNDDSELVDHSRGAEDRRKQQSEKDSEKAARRQAGEARRDEGHRRKEAEREGRGAEFAQAQARSGGQEMGRGGRGGRQPQRRVDPNYQNADGSDLGPLGDDSARVTAEDEEVPGKLSGKELRELDALPSEDDEVAAGVKEEDGDEDVEMGDGAEDGGVKLEEKLDRAEEKAIKETQAEDVLEGRESRKEGKRQQMEEDRAEEVVPGVRDEDASVNRTV